LNADYFCAVCNTPFLNSYPLDENGLCAACKSGLIRFDRAACFGFYEGTLRTLIHLYKYSGMKPLARHFASLMERAFSLGKTGQPLVAVNGLESDADRAEQRALLSLLNGLLGTARNPLAHNAKLDWRMSELDALDVMSLISLVHRKLDAAASIQSTAAR